MIKNYYYLTVGILCLLFAYTHASNGETTGLSVLDESSVGLHTETTFHYVWHIITIENLVFGAGLLIMALYRNQIQVRFVAWMIAAMMVARWIIIFFFILFYENSSISKILTDTIAIIIVVILLIMGAKKGSKVYS